MSNRPRPAIKIPLLPPERLYMCFLEATTAAMPGYPAVVLSYRGVPHEECPDDMFLADIQQFDLSIERPGPAEGELMLEVIAYTQPRKELLDFSDCHFYDCIVKRDLIRPIFKEISDQGRYIVIINTDFYYYKALIDDATGEVLESGMDYRLVN